jgi:CHAT domain-containing protein
VLAGLSRRSSASEQLVNTLLRERFTVGRLAGQKTWEPCSATDGDSLIPRTSCGRSPPEDTLQAGRVDAAERDARPELQSDSSARILRIGALLDLRSGNEVPAHLERAAGSLERARRLAPDDVVVLNDLAVALLEQGERDQQLMPMLRALDVIERAFVRDSTRPEVLFNRALTLQRLYLIKSAERAWARYLAVERHPGWRAEAEAHARRVAQVADTVSWNSFLQSPPERMDAPTRAGITARVHRSPLAAREFGFKLLGQWGSAVERGDGARAAHFLALAREIGLAADALRADRSVSLAVRAIDLSAGDVSRSRALAKGHVALAAGLELYSVAAYDSAAERFGRAESALRSSDSPAARWAAFNRAAAAINRGRYAGADRLLRRVLAEATREEPSLVGKTVWALGVSRLRRGHYEIANRHYREAEPHLVHAKEPDSKGAVSYLLAEGLSLAGQPAAGQVEAYRGLRLLSPFRRYVFLSNHLTTVATYARGSGLSYAALAVMDEVLEVAHAANKPQFVAWALRARARDLIALGQPDAAQVELEEAMRWADRIKAGDGRDRVRADVMMVQGQLARRRDPRTALRLLLGVVAEYRRLKVQLHLPTALHDAALAARAAGDSAGARLLLEQAIEEIERQQTSFETAESRGTFYETVENVFDATIGIELENRRPASAFEYLERGRIALQQPAGRPGASPPTDTVRTGVGEVGARLPADMLFVAYALLGDQIAVWTASRRGWRHYTVPVPRDSVSALVDRFVQNSGEASGGGGSLDRLFDLLIRPLGGELEGVRQLAIVPDRELYRVPFVALRDRETGRYVVEGYEVRTAPSSAFLISAISAARPTRADPPTLVVGNPTIDASLVRQLEPLPGAAREAKRVARLYHEARLLTGPDAQRGRVLDLLSASSIFHFAGHAVFNVEQPGLSYLVLAPGGSGEDGILHAREIGELSLSNLRVVILSACSTLGPKPSRTGVNAGLAYSFLRAGAPATISTLWDVSDDATAELLVEFHRRLAAGSSAANALQFAQLTALRSTRPELSAPQVWAAFTYTGP